MSTDTAPTDTGWIVKEYRKNRIESPVAIKSPQQPSWLTTTLAKVRTFLHIVRTEPRIVDKTPIVSVMLLEAANIQQLWRMWTVHTAAGQSISAWLSVNIALWLWLNFYVVFNRDNKFAIYGTALGIVMNTLVILTVFWFRFVVHAG